MTKRRGVVSEQFIKHIQNTPPKSIVIFETVYICRLTSQALRVLEFGESKVHINSKVLKHLYDRKPSEEFDYIICHLHLIIKYPDRIFKNKNSKSGDFCLVKNLDGSEYLCSVQYTAENEAGQISVVTAFRVRDKKYLKNYELLWSWKGGIPSS